jgi:hypothetical protein
MIRFACPRCKSVLESPDEKAGGKVNCPKCQQRLQVPVPPRSKTMLGSLLPTSEPPRTPPASPPRPVAVPRGKKKRRVVVDIPEEYKEELAYWIGLHRKMTLAVVGGFVLLPVVIVVGLAVLSVVIQYLK